MTEAVDAPSLYESLRVRLPGDVGFHESEELIEALADEFVQIEVVRTNPNAGVGGPIDPAFVESIVLAIHLGAAVGVVAFAKRFFELLAEDAHAGLRRTLVAVAKRISERRKGRAIYIYVMVDGDPDADPHRTLILRWPVSTQADLLQASAAAVKMPSRSLRRGLIYLDWDPQTGTWKPMKSPFDPFPRDGRLEE